MKGRIDGNQGITAWTGYWLDKPQDLIET